MEFGGNTPGLGNEDNDIVLEGGLEDDVLEDSSLDLDVGDIAGSGEGCVVHDFLFQEPEYWQVPRDSLQILDVLRMYKFQVKNDRRDPKKPDGYHARIFGRQTKLQIADYTLPSTKSQLPTIGETIPLRLTYRYDNTDDFSKVNDALELKAVLDANKQPYKESDKQEILRKLNNEAVDKSDAVRQLNKQISERSDLIKRLEGRQ